MNTNDDCSDGFCSLYCPQWCYIIFPPPPPFEFPSDEDSSPSFSPLVIAIISILASAFLLVSYYTIISKFCGNTVSTRRENHDPDGQELEEDNHNSSIHEPWHVPSNGLDEALIKSITVCKYKKGDGLVEGTDCSVCLSVFEEDECLRLLPKCSHAFHISCIDTWLRSHANCPLCRASVVCVNNSSPIQLPRPMAESSLPNSSSSQNQPENVIIVEDLERSSEEEEVMQVPKSTAIPAFSHLGDSERRDAIIEIGEEAEQRIRRSVSMDFSRQTRVSISDILHMNEEGHTQMDRAESSKGSVGEISKSSQRSRVLHSVLSPVGMKRSFSSGRFLFHTRHGRGRI